MATNLGTEEADIEEGQGSKTLNAEGAFGAKQYNRHLPIQRHNTTSNHPFSADESPRIETLWFFDGRPSRGDGCGGACCSPKA